MIIGHIPSAGDYDLVVDLRLPKNKSNQSKKNIEWFISCHSASNVERIKMFADVMDIKAEQMAFFHIM